MTLVNIRSTILAKWLQSPPAHPIVSLQAMPILSIGHLACPMLPVPNASTSPWLTTIRLALTSTADTHLKTASPSMATMHCLHQPMLCRTRLRRGLHLQTVGQRQLKQLSRKTNRWTMAHFNIQTRLSRELTLPPIGRTCRPIFPGYPHWQAIYQCLLIMVEQGACPTQQACRINSLGVVSPVKRARAALVQRIRNTPQKLTVIHGPQPPCFQIRTAVQSPLLVAQRTTRR